jgi:hypothetical protein
MVRIYDLPLMERDCKELRDRREMDLEHQVRSEADLEFRTFNLIFTSF